MSDDNSGRHDPTHVSEATVITHSAASGQRHISPVRFLSPFAPEEFAIGTLSTLNLIACVTVMIQLQSATNDALLEMVRASSSDDPIIKRAVASAKGAGVRTAERETDAVRREPEYPPENKNPEDGKTQANQPDAATILGLTRENPIRKLLIGMVCCMFVGACAYFSL